MLCMTEQPGSNMCAPRAKAGRQGQNRRALSGAERLPRFGGELWAPYLRDTLLRVFASAGISGQLGRFTRPFLDYTSASVRSLTTTKHYIALLMLRLLLVHRAQIPSLPLRCSSIFYGQALFAGPFLSVHTFWCVLVACCS